MNIFHDQFTTGQVTAATGLPNHTLQSWLKRGLLVGNPGSPIKGGGSAGSHRRFTFFTVMEIAVARALIDIGLTASDAISAGKYFAHTGVGPMGETPERMPGLPFDDRGPSGFTLVCVSGDQSFEVFYKPSTDEIVNIRHRLGAGFVVLEINDLFDSVLDILGYDPRDVMAQAYTEATQ